MVMEEQESDMELASESIPVPQVQEPKIDTVKRNNKSGVSRGKPRLRKKALHAAILKLMEFYFSDANLNKDRYLSGLLSENLYVDLNEFTKFNKLRELTTDTNRIAKALQKSTMLKVSEDGTKVCRLTPINKKDNIDECTIYVQNLPPDADHDWLISIFSKYGSVDYVSIPRYKSNRKIKGFAFVEFDTPTSAQACIKTYRKKGCVLPSHTSPNDLLSIITFDDPKKDHTMTAPTNENTRIIKSKDNGKEKASKNETENCNTHHNEMDIVEDNERQSAKKRKLSSEKLLITEENDIKIKKKKKVVDQHITGQQNEKEKATKDENEGNDNICDNVTNMVDNGKQSLKKKKYILETSPVIENDIKVNIIENSSIENQETSNKNIDRNKITEKKKRKLATNDTIIVKDSEETVKKDSHGLATKSSKNKGTESECLNRSDDDNEINATLKTGKHSMMIDDVEEKVISSDIDERKKKRNRKKRSKMQQDDSYTIGLQVMSKQDWKRLRNKYLELQRHKMAQLKQHLRKAEVERGGIITKKKWNYDKSKYEKDNGKINEIEKSSYGRVNYAPGIIVKIEMDQPCTDPQSFKMELKDNNNSVKYIDVTLNSCNAYVRCDTSEAAQSFAQKSYEGRRLTVLKDDEEKSYWDKIARDREEKLSRKERIVQRGRDKLLKKAEKQLGKCIKFDQD